MYYFSVTDKLLNGIAIAIIQVISPCSDGKTKEECHDEFGPFFGRMMIIFTVLSIIITVSVINNSVNTLSNELLSNNISDNTSTIC